MPILLYCVAENSDSLKISTGVAGDQISQRQREGLVILFSRAPASDAWTKAPLHSSAKEFHRVLNQVFMSGPIVPFRFPTVIPSDQELDSHLQAKALEYAAWLKKFKDDAQMEALVSYSGQSATSASSGAEYLKEKMRRQEQLERVATTLRSSTASSATDWRQRLVPQGVRCFALVKRASVPDFNASVKTAIIPESITVRVSGPWPVAEFLEPEKA